MTAHTPGPWFVQPGYLTVYSLSDGDVGLTCALAKPLTDQPGLKAAEANARLIAAAPDLLKALRSIVDVGDRFTGDQDEDSDLGCGRRSCSNGHRQGHRGTVVTARNTPTHRMCPVCGGAGEITCNDSHVGDPQTEYEVICTAEGCEDGWIRCVPEDPMELLRSARLCRGWSPLHGERYGALFARITTDVPLPADPIPATHAWPKAA